MKTLLVPAQALRRRAKASAIRMRVKPRVICMQEMRRKWGSCSSAGAVTLALDLAEEKPSFQDFVIVHELLHLRVPKHGRVFRALMTAYVPGRRKHDATRRCRSVAKSRTARSAAALAARPSRGGVGIA